MSDRDLTARSRVASRVGTRGRRTRAFRRRVRNRRLAGILVLLSLGGMTAAAITLLDPLGRAIKELTLPLRHEDIIRQQARQKQLDPALIAAVIYGESKFRDQTSTAGAQGLMQILPDTAHFVARRTGGTKFEDSDLSNAQINIAYGCWYLRYLLDRYDQNEVAAIAAYNAGHQRVDHWGGRVLRLQDIRFPETAQYTREVLDKRDEYAKRYRRELGL